MRYRATETRKERGDLRPPKSTVLYQAEALFVEVGIDSPEQGEPPVGRARFIRPPDLLKVHENGANAEEEEKTAEDAESVRRRHDGWWGPSDQG